MTSKTQMLKRLVKMRRSRDAWLLCAGESGSTVVGNLASARVDAYVSELRRYGRRYYESCGDVEQMRRASQDVENYAAQMSLGI